MTNKATIWVSILGMAVALGLGACGDDEKNPTSMDSTSTTDESTAGETQTDEGTASEAQTSTEPVPYSCEVYCEVSKLCDPDFSDPSPAACVDSCQTEDACVAAEVGQSCNDALTQMWTCLVNQDCDGYLAFWAAMGQAGGPKPADEFPCKQEFATMYGEACSEQEWQAVQTGCGQ